MQEENMPDEDDVMENKDGLTEWKNEPKLHQLKADYTLAKPDRDAAIARIDTYIDNLNVTGSAKKKFLKGRSQVQPKLIRKQAEWRYGSLSEPLLSTYDLFDVEPVTAEDKDAARQNQLLLNYQFSTQINKQKFIDDYVRTGVDEGTIILRTGWETREETITRTIDTYEYQQATDPGVVQMIIQALALKNSAPAEYMVLPEALKRSAEYTEAQGGIVAYQAIRSGKKKVTEEVMTANHPTVEVVDYHNFMVDPMCEGDIDKAQFAIYSFETSLSELEQYPDRYKNLDKLNITDGTSDPIAQPDHYVDNDTDFNFSDKPRKKFVAYEYWGYWDINGDGTVEPFVATWVGDVLIRMERSPYPDGKLPFVIVQYLPVRRQTYGEPDGALLKENQDVIGAVTRGMIDMMGRSAAGQKGIRQDALDAVNRRKYNSGQDYEFNPTVDPRVAVIDHSYPEIPGSAQYMLDMQNQDAESLTGVKAFSSGISGQALGDTATAVRGALDAASKRELGILRRLADGLVQVGRKFIAMNAEFLDEEEVIRVTAEEFVPIRRDDLAGNFDLRLTVSTAEADNQKASELAFMLQTMGNSLPLPMSQIILADIARLRQMPALAKQIEDYVPEPDPVQQLEAQKLQLEIAYIQAQIQNLGGKTNLDAAKAQESVAKAANLNADTDKKALEYVEEELGVNHEREMQKIAAQAEANTRMKVVEAALQPAKETKQPSNTSGE